MTFIVKYEEKSILEEVIEAKSKEEAIEIFNQMVDDDEIDFSEMVVTNTKTSSRKAKKDSYGYWY